MRQLLAMIRENERSFNLWSMVALQWVNLDHATIQFVTLTR